MTKSKYARNETCDERRVRREYEMSIRKFAQMAFDQTPESAELNKKFSYENGAPWTDVEPIMWARQNELKLLFDAFVESNYYKIMLQDFIQHGLSEMYALKYIFH
jgi:hypothetical protein